MGSALTERSGVITMTIVVMIAMNKIARQLCVRLTGDKKQPFSRS